ncbi:hypothetical protein ACFL18_02890, partial [Patescibacteria group bacterium]
MTDTLRLNVGDLVVRYGKILKVTKVSKNNIELQPLYNTNTNNQITYSVKTQITDNHFIRRLTEKKELKRLLTQLSKPLKSTADYLKIQADPKTNLLKDSLSV